MIQAARRLYRVPGQHLTIGQVVELSKRFMEGYLHYQHEPRIIELRKRVIAYNRLLRDMGIADHQVERASNRSFKSLLLLVYRTGLLLWWGLLSFPGVILHAPVFILAKIISHKKAKGEQLRRFIFAFELIPQRPSQHRRSRSKDETCLPRGRCSFRWRSSRCCTSRTSSSPRSSPIDSTLPRNGDTGCQSTSFSSFLHSAILHSNLGKQEWTSSSLCDRCSSPSGPAISGKWTS